MVARVEQELHASVKGFVEKIRIKLDDNPRLIVERENPFFSVLGRLEILVHLASMIFYACLFLQF